MYSLQRRHAGNVTSNVVCKTITEAYSQWNMYRSSGNSRIHRVARDTSVLYSVDMAVLFLECREFITISWSAQAAQRIPAS